MRFLRRLVIIALLSMLPGPMAQAGIRIGVGIGIGYPGYYGYRPYCGYYRPWYPGIGVVVPVGPVVVPASPVVVGPAYYTSAPPPALTAVPTAAPPTLTPVGVKSVEIDRYLQHLSNPDEKARTEAVLQLGRLHATQAEGQLTQVLAADHSPQVREAAARGLGLIGSNTALPALQQAAQADDDKEVRNSARFAVDVIRSQK
jgi:HEAT repeats